MNKVFILNELKTPSTKLIVYKDGDTVPCDEINRVKNTFYSKNAISPFSLKMSPSLFERIIDTTDIFSIPL